MARKYGVLVLASLFLVCVCESVIVNPVSDAHRSAALELLSHFDGSLRSLEETYEAVRVLKILGIEKKLDATTTVCASVTDTLQSTSSASEDLFNAIRVNSILMCEHETNIILGVISSLKDNLNDADSLLGFYHFMGGLVLIKDQYSDMNVHLENADKVFRSVKALSQSDGRWRFSSTNPESSLDAAGIALETLAGIVLFAAPEIDYSLIGLLKSDITKLFDTIERYDDGAFYFDEKVVGVRGYQGPLSVSASVVRGITAFAAAASENINLPGDKILGLAKFFLGIGVPGSAKELYNQIDALAYLENIRGSIPLVLSLPSTVLSVTRKEQLKVRVSTVLGSPAPPLAVNLKKFLASGSKDAFVLDQRLTFDPERALYVLEKFPTNVDIGNYIFWFEIILDDPEQKKVYVTGGRTKVSIHVTGVVEIKNAEIAILDSDLGSVEMQKKLDLPGTNSVSLSANHLQKLRLSFHLRSPSGHAFKPHQAFISLRHESGVEHIFVMVNTGKKHEILLDYLGLVDKFYYLSGKYSIQLTVGDPVMENSFLQALGHVELDLPDAPETAARPPSLLVEPYFRYGPKAEISHVFRAPEKRPPRELSLLFLGLVLLPLLGFLIGLVRLGVNLKNFPRSTIPLTFAAHFHCGITAVLILYAIFWFKLDLFTTLKALGFLGMMLMFVGHKTLSHLASSSAKLKST